MYFLTVECASTFLTTQQWVKLWFCVLVPAFLDSAIKKDAVMRKIVILIAFTFEVSCGGWGGGGGDKN
jgi:hypothetical protein